MGGVGLLFGMLAANAHAEFELDDVPQRRAYDLRDQGERHATVANVLFGVGAAMATTGLVLLASGPSAPDKAAVTPVLGPTGLGLTGRF